MRPIPPGRSGYYEAMQKFAPILGGVLFVVIALAIGINFVQERLNPPPAGEKFDAVENFSRLNARGMTNLVMRPPERRDSQERSRRQD
jgi:hypothetical protein